MSEETVHPFFRYQPNCYKNGTFIQLEDGEAFACPCCGKQTDIYYANALYAEDEVTELCPNCIIDGSAAETFNGIFIQDAEEVGDQEKENELFKRTPGYASWQGEHWLSCCGDYCAFIARVGIEELQEMGIADDVLSEYAQQNEYEIEVVRNHLGKDGSLCGYLFKCLHCGKYRLWVDAD